MTAKEGFKHDDEGPAIPSVVQLFALGHVPKTVLSQFVVPASDVIAFR
jgi:hypothetical protein